MSDSPEINSVTNPPQGTLEERLARIPAEAWDPSLRGPMTPEEAQAVRASIASGSQSAPAAAPAAAPVTQGASDAARLLYTQFQAVDPSRQGVGLDKLRPFYPRVAWSVILASVKELEDAGLLRSRNVMGDRGAISYKLYSWVTP